MTSNWAELNPELLHVIAKKLENFSNFIRFRSVCKQWRLFVDPIDYPPSLPWILHSATNPSSIETHTKTDFIIYSISSNPTSQITVPITRQDYISTINGESTFGFLLSQDPFKGSYLLNPLTMNKFYLPFSRPPLFIIYVGPDPDRNSSTVKGGVHVVICRSSENGPEIGFWKSQNNEFTSFRVPAASRAMGYYKSKLFVYWAGKTTVFDMTTGAQMNIVIENAVDHPGYVFLVEAMGDLLCVALSSKVVSGCGTIQFNVYRLEHTDDFGQRRWIKLKGIGDRMLFLTSCRSTSFCLSSCDFNGLSGNCIYHLLNKRVVRYNMEDGTTGELLKFPSSSVKWFMPCLI